MFLKELMEFLEAIPSFLLRLRSLNLCLELLLLWFLFKVWGSQLGFLVGSLNAFSFGGFGVYKGLR